MISCANTADASGSVQEAVPDEAVLAGNEQTVIVVQLKIGRGMRCYQL